MRDQTKAVIQFYEWINNALEITALYFDFGLWKMAKKTLHFIIAIFFRRIISTERFFLSFRSGDSMISHLFGMKLPFNSK